MSLATISLLTIVFLFVLFLLGLEIGFAMALAGFIGFAAVVNVDAAFNLLAKDIYSAVSSVRFNRHTDVCVHGAAWGERGCGAESL